MKAQGAGLNNNEEEQKGEIEEQKVEKNDKHDKTDKVV